MINLKQNKNNPYQKTIEEYLTIWTSSGNEYYGIRTYTGKDFILNQMNPDMICIEDIAHALSHQCRFGGHTKQFYSVAQHCLWMAKQADENKLECLLHDATEAYLIDIPKPIKKLLPNYCNYENQLHEQIAMKFNLCYPYPQNVHELDYISSLVEWEGLMINDHIKCLSPAMAERRFLELFYKLKK